MDIEVKDSSINSFMIEGLSKKIPLIDIFILLSKQVNDIKKITFLHEPINYISNDFKCQVDFTNHDSLIKAKLILKALNLNNLFNTKEPKIRISDCLLNQSNLINESVSQTSALMFENMQINNINILEFIFHLKKYIFLNNQNDKSKYKITKVRQYSNRILVIFEPNVPECIKKYIPQGTIEDHPQNPYFNYKNKNIPVIPKMKPVVNIGKYKEKNMKLSVYNINEDDRENLHSIFEKRQDNDENLTLSKMAENAFNNILNSEKLMREEKLKKNNIMNNNNLSRKRDRERERDRTREKSGDKGRHERENNSNYRDKNRENRKNDINNRMNRDIREHRRDKNKERREDSSSDRDRQGDMMNMNNNNYRNKGANNFIEGNNIGNNNNNNNNINNNLSGLNISEKDLNQVASLFSNANAMNIVKYLLENNAFNNNNNPPKNNNNQNLNSNNNNLGNINNINNNNINNNNLIQNKLPIKSNDDPNSINNVNLLKNNYNDLINNLYNQNPNNINNTQNFQQLLTVLQSQNQNNIINNNKNNQPQQRINNNSLNNNLGNNFQNVMNVNQMMRMENNTSNLMNNNYFNNQNQRQFQFPLSEQFMSQFSNKKQ